jgi:hypothetical protein
MGEQCLSLYTEAFEKEREAALLADFMQNPEPEYTSSPTKPTKQIQPYENQRA